MVWDTCDGSVMVWDGGTCDGECVMDVHFIFSN